jgi:hypothetical protein
METKSTGDHAAVDSGDGGAAIRTRLALSF